jgi:hypothetical protein
MIILRLQYREGNRRIRKKMEVKDAKSGKNGAEGRKERGAFIANKSRGPKKRAKKCARAGRGKTTDYSLHSRYTQYMPPIIHSILCQLSTNKTRRVVDEQNAEETKGKLIAILVANTVLELALYTMNIRILIGIADTLHSEDEV